MKPEDSEEMNHTQCGDDKPGIRPNANGSDGREDNAGADNGRSL